MTDAEYKLEADLLLYKTLSFVMGVFCIFCLSAVISMVINGNRAYRAIESLHSGNAALSASLAECRMSVRAEREFYVASIRAEAGLR